MDSDTYSGQIDMKPIAIDGKSFGETFHVAAAIALNPQCKVVVMPPEDGDAETAIPTQRIIEFLRLFTDPRNVEEIDRPTKDEHKKKYSNVGESTDLYCANWSGTTVPLLREPILRATASRIPDIEEFLDRRGIKRDSSPSALIWLRLRTDFEAERNSTKESADDLQRVIENCGIRPIFVGNGTAGRVAGHGNLIDFYRVAPFTNSEHFIALQLLMVQRLMCNYGVRFSVGMKSGGMDGAALFLGLPTITFAQCSPNERPWRKKNRVEKMAVKIGNFKVVPLASYAENFQSHTARELDDFSAEIRALGFGYSETSSQ